MLNGKLLRMRQWIFLMSLLFSANVGVSQIAFVKLADWKEVLELAKKENKGIFVDFYATWCGPCKYMDQYIYPDTVVGGVYNAKYVSVRLQCDTGRNDNAVVKDWYGDVSRLVKEYHIAAYPTLMYFSPDGAAVHITSGMRQAADFVMLGLDALEPDKQYFTSVRKFREGKADSLMVRRLIGMANALGDTAVGGAVTRFYLDSMRLHAPKEKIFAKTYLQFLAEALNRKYVGSRDSVFHLLYMNQDRVNQVMNDSTFSRRFIDYVVSVEYLDPVLSRLWATTKEEPDWTSLMSEIDERFSAEIARKVIAFGKDRWYSATKNWKRLAAVEDDILKDYGAFVDDFTLNNKAWAVFQECSEMQVLKSAVGWSARVLKDTAKRQDGTTSNYMDTYANLLYKLGKLKEALFWERRACDLDPQNTEFKERLQLMETGRPTWKDA